jgi:hypothetical protein
MFSAFFAEVMPTEGWNPDFNQRCLFFTCIAFTVGHCLITPQVLLVIPSLTRYLEM